MAETRVAKPNDQQSEVLGDVELTLMVAKTHLDSGLQGVAIHANGELLETTLAGAEGQPMSQYIFGHIDVPALDDDSAPIPALSRSMQLNRSNEVVQTLMAFIGFEVDRLRRELVKEDKARRAQEETKKLNREARLIAEMINSDFREFSDRIARVKAKSGTGHDLGKSPRDSGDDVDELIPGKDVSASHERNVPEPTPPGPSPDDPPEPSPNTSEVTGRFISTLNIHRSGQLAGKARSKIRFSGGSPTKWLLLNTPMRSRGRWTKTVSSSTRTMLVLRSGKHLIAWLAVRLHFTQHDLPGNRACRFLVTRVPVIRFRHRFSGRCSSKRLGNWTCV
jgi:hypothetical protein